MDDGDLLASIRLNNLTAQLDTNSAAAHNGDALGLADLMMIIQENVFRIDCMMSSKSTMFEWV